MQVVRELQLSSRSPPSTGVKGEHDRLLRVHQHLGARLRVVVQAYQVASNMRPPVLLSH